MLQNDKWIVEQANKGMITPFYDRSIRKVNDISVISFGLSSYGYDICLAGEELKLFVPSFDKVVDPKDFDPDNVITLTPQNEGNGDYFLLPAHSYALGASVESFNIPSNVTAIAMGKSTYARCGLIVNITPLEAGWKAQSLTLEFANTSDAEIKIYANEGIAQLLFFQGEPCRTNYSDRAGKYQNQGCGVTFAKV